MSVKLTGRARAAGYALAGLLAFGAGVTAQHWDPYTRHLDATTVRVSVPVEEDEAWCVGAEEVAYTSLVSGAEITCQR